MFHTILTLSYTIPALYLFIRIWQLFIERKDRLKYVLVFAFLFSIYPFSNVLEGEAPGAARVAEFISGYLLPFFLYLFLLMLLTDILLLINLPLRIISWEKLRTRTIRNRYFEMIISASVLIVIAGIINFNTIRTTDYKITIPGKSSDIKGLRIAFVSDFHLEYKVPARFVESFVDKIRETDPDLILYGGDIVEGSGENLEEYEELLGSIEPRYGVYGVLGNHDRIRNFKENFFTRAGITLLRDSIVTAGNSFTLIGRNDSRGNRKSIAELTVAAPDELPVIVIDHRPTDIDQISRASADISFSGHTHNGQLFPINFYICSLYELCHGHLMKGNTNFFVSSGIRLWGPPVRTTGKSEVVVVEVIFAAM